MEVTLLRATDDMVGIISFAAGVCYGKEDSSLRRLDSCYKAGHASILEHASVSFLVKGISRSCSHQLVRHRMASYCQESQRYCKYDMRGHDWYVTPPEVQGNTFALAEYKYMMEHAAKAYRMMLSYGIKPEDARFVLPESTKTAIVVTMNMHSLFHFFDLRLGKRAQWEVRELAENMKSIMDNIEPDLMAVYEKYYEGTRID